MAKSPKILIVEDNDEMRGLVSRLLKRDGYRVSNARDGAEMERALSNENVDLVILDVMLPGKDGLSLCRQLRDRSNVPVIIVSAKGEEVDRVVGLKMGADDYLPKPFSSAELLARIETVLRRTAHEGLSDAVASGEVYDFDRWSLNVASRELTGDSGVVVPLSTGEFDLLIQMVRRPNRVMTRVELLDLARGRDSVAFDRSIDTQISRLRKKIERDPSAPKILKTVWGAGYIFAADVKAG